ncbi:LysR family transcriptional regulator, partial [Mesorhizobium sp. M00.F.Ca.ET.186.01.1.1]
ALFLHRRDAEPEPVAARLADILLEAARQALPENTRTAGLRAAA